MPPLDLYLSIGLSLSLAGLAATNLALWRVWREGTRQAKEIRYLRSEIRRIDDNARIVADTVNFNAIATAELSELMEENDFVRRLGREIHESRN